MIFDIGPFQLYRVEKTGTIDICLRCMSDWACGWEYGWQDEMPRHNKPIIELRIGKLVIFYLAIHRIFCEVRFMGFWAFPSWGKGDE